jgi:hypothetical protein
MKTWVKLVLVLGGLAALLAYVFISGEQEDARRTAKGTAVVTAVKLNEDLESRSLDETEFALRVDAGGSAVETTATLPGDRTGEFDVGDNFTVCYDPADPKDADIELDAAATCGS